uniref:Putative secreted protein n=1 Tax=Anopheles triannulatus TaxID=58253 RepID=A0A2M4AWP5_9DIPT
MDRDVAIGLTLFFMLFLIGSYLLGRRSFRRRTKQIVVTQEIPGNVPAFSAPQLVECDDAQQYGKFGTVCLTPSNPPVMAQHIHEKHNRK